MGLTGLADKNGFYKQLPYIDEQGMPQIKDNKDLQELVQDNCQKLLQDVNGKDNIQSKFLKWRNKKPSRIAEESKNKALV